MAYDRAVAPRTGAVMSGEAGGTSGWLRFSAWRTAYASAGGLLALVCVVDVTSKLHDLHGRVPAWQPVAWETSSIATVLAFAWIIFGAADAILAKRLGLMRAMPVHAAAMCVFSLCHCIGMWTLRRLIYTAAGAHYGWNVPASQIFYEFRKDTVTYVVIFLIYRGVQHMRHAATLSASIAPAHATAAASGVSLPASATPQAGPRENYDIRDGARLWRVRIKDIAAVMSAGNYVEFRITDGRRMLVRGTLSGVLTELAPSGFLRVHRSWLVNQDHVRGVEPDRSGDYTLTMDDAQCVPLSRRFPDALAHLRHRNAGLPASAAGHAASAANDHALTSPAG